MKKIVTAGVIIVSFALVAGLAIYLSAPKAEYSQSVLTGLAHAIAAKGITMYGAAWCPHCQAEKARFGAAFSYVPYVECPANEKLCLNKGVTGYPTWITSDGTKYVGEQGIERLAEIAGYDLSAR